MWMTRCRVLVQRCFNFYHARNIETKYPSELSHGRNYYSCQQTEQARNPFLCQQTRLLKNTVRNSPLQSSFQIRNIGTGAHFYPSLVQRLMSMDCKGPPDKELTRQVKKPVPTPSGCNNLIIHERQVRQNFHQKCEDKINDQIKDELLAAYTYISMASFCSQDNVALDGFGKFFTLSFHEEIEHMEKFVSYLNKRGGQLCLTAIAAPPKQEWKQAEELVMDALEMEKSLNEKLLQLHSCASEHGDAHLTDFLEEHYLQEQVNAIKALADLLTTLRRAKKDLSVHLVNRQLQEDGFSAHGNGK